MQDGSTLKNSVFLNPRSLVCEMLRQEPSGTESGQSYRILQSNCTSELCSYFVILVTTSSDPLHCGHTHSAQESL
jgi:hypothetical protein